jgi:hypothetical protein
MNLRKTLSVLSFLFLSSCGIALSQEGDFFGIPLSSDTAPVMAKTNSDFQTISPGEVWQLGGGKEKKGPLQYYWVDGNQGKGKMRLHFGNLSRLKGRMKECFLVLHVANTRNSGSTGGIWVRTYGSSKKIGLHRGAPKGKEVKISLEIPSTESLNPLVIEVVTGSGNGMRFLGKGAKAPYLEVR